VRNRLLLLLLLPLTAAFQVPEREGDPCKGLQRWYGRWDRQGALWPEAMGEYSALLADIVDGAPLPGVRLTAAAGVLLDLAGWGIEELPTRSDFEGRGAAQRVRRRARAAFEELLDGRDAEGERLASWLTDEVLLQSSQPLERRLAAIDVCVERRLERAKLALLTVGHRPEDPLWPAAVDALTGWPDPLVDRFLVGLVGKTYDRAGARHPYTLLLARIQGSDEPLGERAADQLRERLRHSLLSTDWREAGRAIEIMRGLVPEQAVPILIEALSTWKRRERAGRGALRTIADIVGELRRISGRSLGSNPDQWVTWWLAVREGRVEIAVEDGAGEEQRPRTRAAFFGLRPVTDQVTFVIDISGSMATEWGTSGHTRYVEAVEQMTRFLQATGPQTRFNVILFSDRPYRSSAKLLAATPSNLSRARASLLRREPDGDTNLRPAVELSLRLDVAGRFDVDRLEADTIIVLCDGETAEGRGWVKPLLERIQEQARVRIHCVLVGTRGDGTLDDLAQGSGGELLRIGG